MSSLRRAAAVLVFAVAPLLATAAEAQVPHDEISRPCGWLNPATKGYAFCLEQHLKRMRELAAENEMKVPVAITPEHKPRVTRRHAVKPKRVLSNRDG